MWSVVGLYNAASLSSRGSVLSNMAYEQVIQSCLEETREWNIIPLNLVEDARLNLALNVKGIDKRFILRMEKNT